MKKVGKLNGKVVVAGDKNLVTANQIHYEEKDGNITLSERKRGELSSVTGSGSSGEGSEFLYYKVVYNNYTQELNALIPSLIGFLDIIKFKSSEFNGSDIGLCASISSSSLFGEEDTLLYIRGLLRQNKLLGFTIYKGSRGVINYNENTLALTTAGTLKDKFIGLFFKEMPPEEQSSPENQELLKYISDVLDSCFILISKEEYEALS